MTDTNYMQVVKCDCGEDVICSCGRCVKCGELRNEDQSIVGIIKKRMSFLHELRKKELVSTSCIEDDIKMISRMYSSSILNEQDYWTIMDFCKENEIIPKDDPPTEGLSASSIQAPKAAEQDAPPCRKSFSESDIQVLYGKVNQLWTEVFSTEAPSRQTLRGAVLDLCTVNNVSVKESALPSARVNPPKAPWSV